MSKRFIFSSVILLALFICALFAPYLSSFDPQHVEISNKLMAPDAVHLLGTDQLGRDILSRLLHGARYSLFLSLTISSAGSGYRCDSWLADRMVPRKS